MSTCLSGTLAGGMFYVRAHLIMKKRIPNFFTLFSRRSKSSGYCELAERHDIEMCNQISKNLRDDLTLHGWV